MIPPGVPPLAYMRAHFIAWRHNLRNRIGRFVSRHLVRLTPRCECGWALVQRFDGPWVCGACLNGTPKDCPCYLCLRLHKGEAFETGDDET